MRIIDSQHLHFLKERAGILKKIRTFFDRNNVIEIETPLLYPAPVTDPYLHALSIGEHDQKKYLQTSPEFAMKRLLCAGFGDMYQICKAFRDEESGRLHNIEFTILEWYRLGFDHHDLMNETALLLKESIGANPAQNFSYQSIFQQYLNINPHDLSDEKKALEKLCRENKINLINQNTHQLDKDDYCHLLMTHVIEPKLKTDFDALTPVFIYDFPASQAALAKTGFDSQKKEIAERFEVYLSGIELANGYHECQNAKVQRKRFQQDLEKRKKCHLPEVPVDEEFLNTLETQGLPQCAGIALGIDRLIMVALNKKSIAEVMSYHITPTNC